MFASCRILSFHRCVFLSSSRPFYLSTCSSRWKLVRVSSDPTCFRTSKTTYRVVDVAVNNQNSFKITEYFKWSHFYNYLFFVTKPFHKLISHKFIVKMERTRRRPLDPPESVRGMTKLDKELFKTTANILSMRIPVTSMSDFSKKMRKSLLKLPKIRPIAELNEDDLEKENVKLVLFDPEKYSSVNDFSKEEQTILKKLDVDINSAKYVDIDLNYENWNSADILRAVLPTGSETVSGFTAIGHIAHFNIKDEHLDYKYFIGEVILEKTKTVTTVVNKLNTIDNTYRNFQMELLAGEENYVATTKENGASFQLDFSKVYWNSRLGTEHKRIADLCPKDAVVYDVFAGVGPFAVPLAKKGCTVLANDLNPESYKWLKNNIELNKHKGNVKTYNLDGRKFIRNIVREDLTKRLKDSVSTETAIDLFVVMNLPALAIEFLDAFVGIGTDISADARDLVKMPQIFCYCFTKSEDPKADIAERLTSSLGNCPDLDFTLFYVRNVAPNKDMYRVSFTLPKSAVFDDRSPVGKIKSVSEIEELPATKKQKIA